MKFKEALEKEEKKICKKIKNAGFDKAFILNKKLDLIKELKKF